MKRTKEKTEKNDEEEVRSRMYDGEVSGAMAERAAAMSEDKSNETDVNDAEMANRLSKTIAKKFASKRDNTGKPSIVKSTHTTETSALLANTSNFLAQVRAETDLNKKAKPNFLKPPSD